MDVSKYVSVTVSVDSWQLDRFKLQPISNSEVSGAEQHKVSRHYSLDPHTTVVFGI